mmetsp:Transcript_85140/g.147633  ORF Transcript_85140/g.147633 Transcript_85140/m.147633 type:complete len:135 (-) Transcript_85140:130-534(-)
MFRLSYTFYTDVFATCEWFNIMKWVSVMGTYIEVMTPRGIDMLAVLWGQPFGSTMNTTFNMDCGIDKLSNPYQEREDGVAVRDACPSKSLEEDLNVPLPLLFRTYGVCCGHSFHYRIAATLQQTEAHFLSLTEV